MICAGVKLIFASQRRRKEVDRWAMRKCSTVQVYVVERMSAEGKFFHRACFRCDYCNILLRLGMYANAKYNGTCMARH
jgi:hypothetical protein